MSGLKRSVDETSRRPRREGRHRKVRNKEGIDIEINKIRTSLVQGGTTRTGDNKSKKIPNIKGYNRTADSFREQSPYF